MFKKEVKEVKNYRYYLEVIGGVKEEQKYVVKASRFEAFSYGFYTFYDENDNMVALYPINRTIIKSIEEL